MMKSVRKKCFKCDAEIYFDPNRQSKNGKMIPLNPATDEPHDCMSSNYKPKKTLGEEIMELDERERSRK